MSDFDSSSAHLPDRDPEVVRYILCEMDPTYLPKGPSRLYNHIQLLESEGYIKSHLVEVLSEDGGQFLICCDGDVSFELTAAGRKLAASLDPSVIKTT